MVKDLTAVFISALLFLGLTLSAFANLASAESDDAAFPTLSMPVEHVNYTITSINGSLWAKIDGTYPIQLLNQSNLKTPYLLPMVYPTPPETTNIKITIDDKNLDYANYTRDNPSFLHHTAIGDWAMIYSVLPLESNVFTLKIHYEHPLQSVNGSYLFLYDLNISPYLSAKSNNSIAYFTIHLQTNATNISAFTAETDTKWNPISFVNQGEVSNQTLSIVMHSEFEKPLLGDLVVEFSSANQVPGYPFWLISAVAIGLTLSTLLIARNKRLHAKF
jgi:hypothetical protein